MEYAKSKPFHSCHSLCMAKDTKKEAEVDTTDSYSDPECHKLIDWDVVTRVIPLKAGFSARAKTLNSVGDLKPLSAGLHARLVKAGVLEVAPGQ